MSISFAPSDLSKEEALVKDFTKEQRTGNVQESFVPELQLPELPEYPGQNQNGR